MRLRWYDSILILLFCYLFILQVHAIWPFTIDDMYISLRYAKHWAAGDGLLWNVHEPPVEGYSNFSFVVLGAFTLLLKGNPVLVLKATGLVGLFFTCSFVYLISRFWFDTRESFLPCFGLLLYKGQIIWATSGLETAVYQALICGAVYCCFIGMGYQLFPKPRRGAVNKAFIGAGFLLSLAGMTRPEAPALMILFFILMCWDKPKNDTRTAYWRGILFFCLTIGVFYGPYFLWRIVYFGYLFPNSVYCKGLAKTFTLNLDINYLMLIGLLVLFSLPAFIRPIDKRVYFLGLPSLVYLLMLSDSDPVVAFDNRLFLPAFALLLPLVLKGVSTIVSVFWQKKDDVSNLLIYWVSFVIALFFIPAKSLADYRYFSENPLRGEQLRAQVLHWLKNHAGAGDKVVLADSGMIPYLSDLNFIDSYCLNNVSMAHYPIEHRYAQFCKEVEHKEPKIIILTSLIEKGEVLYTPSDVCLKRFLSQGNGYVFKKMFANESSDSNYRYEVYKKSKF